MTWLNGIIKRIYRLQFRAIEINGVDTTVSLQFGGFNVFVQICRFFEVTLLKKFLLPLKNYMKDEKFVLKTFLMPSTIFR